MFYSEVSSSSLRSPHRPVGHLRNLLCAHVTESRRLASVGSGQSIVIRVYEVFCSEWWAFEAPLSILFLSSRLPYNHHLLLHLVSHRRLSIWTANCTILHSTFETVAYIIRYSQKLYCVMAPSSVRWTQVWGGRDIACDRTAGQGVDYESFSSLARTMSSVSPNQIDTSFI